MNETRILHVLDHSLPQQSGYASRSHSILTSLGRMGVSVEAITSPKHGVSATGSDVIDGIRYLRSAVAGNSGEDGAIGQIRSILETRKRISAFLRNGDVALIHVHSPCLNGFAARSHNRPVLYEMRASWEDAAVSSGITEDGSIRYRLSRALETHLIRQVPAVVVICQGLKQDLISRGIDEKKITVVPNAIPEKMLAIGSDEEAVALRHRFGFVGKHVIGFFGSFFEWEGLDTLLQAMPKIVAAVPDARLLLTGGGRQENHLRNMVNALGLGTIVTFAGRVDADAIRAYYRLADVMVYPRVPHRLTEIVTPLKPLEAMAQKTPVIASNVGGHRELIDDERTGFLYPAADTDALAAKVSQVLGAGSVVDDVIRAGRQFVEQDRRWSVVCERYIPIYEDLLGRVIIAERENIAPATVGGQR